MPVCIFEDVMDQRRRKLMLHVTVPLLRIEAIMVMMNIREKKNDWVVSTTTKVGETRTATIQVINKIKNMDQTLSNVGTAMLRDRKDLMQEIGDQRMKMCLVRTSQKSLSLNP